jgi:repressor LexA
MQTKQSNQTKPLTPRQLQLLTMVAAFQTSRCYSPTMAEIAEELRISRSTAFEHIAKLRRKRLLSASSGRARSLTITSKAQELLNHRTACPPAPLSKPPAAGIPLLGRVAAGRPIEAIEEAQPLSIDSFFAGPDTFALQVAGDSMAGSGIFDGDYVICKKTPTADNGRLVIALLDDCSVTLKRFYKEKSRIRLQPANDAYAPIYSTDCSIHAVVIGLIRKL